MRAKLGRRSRFAGHSKSEYDRQWALTLLDRVEARLRDEIDDEIRELFQVLQRPDVRSK